MQAAGYGGQVVFVHLFRNQGPGLSMRLRENWTHGKSRYADKYAKQDTTKVKITDHSASPEEWLMFKHENAVEIKKSVLS
jgi:hypothetical protein